MAAVFGLLCGFVATAASADNLLFDHGTTEWKIHLSPQADPTEKYAAQELQAALKKISGADFEIVAAEKTPDKKAIIIGSLSNAEVSARADQLKLSKGKVEEVSIRTLDGRLYLAGNDPRGALYAVYSFLQNQLGVRWLWPGPGGEFMPAKASWVLPEIVFSHQPAIAYRGFHLCGDYYMPPDSEIFREWMGRNFINIYRHSAPLLEKRRGFYSMWSSHNVSLPRTLFDQHPEYFAEVAGKRHVSNICFSNPEVDKIIAEALVEKVNKLPYLDILSVFPTDTTVYCRCAKCATMDPSTAWFEFYNRLTDGVKKRFPDLKLATVAYFEYRPVPKCQIRNTEFIEYCSFSRCNIHPYGRTGCAHNENTMKEMLEWKATGLPIGNYGYEFDLFKKNRRFTPFLSVIDDAIKTGRKLGHVAMIPEVALVSVKYVPSADYVFNVQNRLPTYLYARLLWDPDSKMTDILHDWCATAFGEAAAPMYQYYLSMDRSWSAMPGHATILGNGLDVAPNFITDKLRTESTAAFAAAEQVLSKIANPAATHQSLAAIKTERTLFDQWLDLYQMSNSDIRRQVLPLLSQASGFASSTSKPEALASTVAGATSYPTQVSLAWTSEALLIKWVCDDPKITDLKFAASVRDGKVLEDDSVEVILSSGPGGEPWHFAVNVKGTQQDYRETSVGVRDDLWNPEWQAKAQLGGKQWTVNMAIPFKSVGESPKANESWQARFIRHNGGRQGSAESAFPEREMSALFFSPASRAGRSILWWHGKLEDVKGKSGSAATQLVLGFAHAGWILQQATSQEQLNSLHEPCDAYWFRHPAGPNPVPAEYWRQHVVPAVKNGAVAVFASYGSIPLEKYFHDPSLKVKAVGCGKLSLAGRVTDFIAPGEWSRKPNDLISRLKTRATPATGYMPEDASKWTVLATAPAEGGRLYPYILARPYGKGMIFVCGDAIPLTSADMLENFVLYHQRQSNSALH